MLGGGVGMAREPCVNARTTQWQAILAQQRIALVFETGGDLLPRLMVTLAILVALLTLVVPILAKLRSGHDGTDGERHSALERLVLVRGSDGVFRDSLGQRYRVERVGEQS